MTKQHKGEGHRKRLREKFLTSGLSGFHDYEVVELLLTLATPRKDCKKAAKEALTRFKTLQGVFEASPGDLCGIPGIGNKNQLGIRLIKEAAERYLEKKITNTTPLTNSTDLYNYLKLDIRDKSVECFNIIYLDAKNRVLAAETLFKGTLTASSVYPREVVISALEHKSAALIFAHNHPSGDPNPSPEDIDITRRLIFACRVIGIVVHEHIIIGGNEYFSFADQGYIARLNREYENQKWNKSFATNDTNRHE